MWDGPISVGMVCVTFLVHQYFLKSKETEISIRTENFLQDLNGRLVILENKELQDPEEMKKLKNQVNMLALRSGLKL